MVKTQTVIVPLKPDDEKKVDIKIGIKPTFNSQPGASANGAQPMMIAVKTGNGENPILIPIQNPIKVQNSENIPTDISPITNTGTFCNFQKNSQKS